jgi:hypothetical protein
MVWRAISENCPRTWLYAREVFSGPTNPCWVPSNLYSVPIIPISALNRDNITNRLPSPKSPWYKGWKKDGQSGTGLLEVFDIALGS